MTWFSKFSAPATKAHLKMTINRTSQAQNKLANNASMLKREIATLLRTGKEEKARIKAEQLIQDQKLECALDVLGTYCELLSTRIKYLESEKECPHDLVSTVSSVLYCEKRTGIEDLGEVRKQLEKKFGREFIETAASNKNQEVHFRLIQLLSIIPPLETEVLKTLATVATEYGVQWSPPPEALAPHDNDDMSFLATGQAPQAPPLGTGMTFAPGKAPNAPFGAVPAYISDAALPQCPAGHVNYIQQVEPPPLPKQTYLGMQQQQQESQQPQSYPGMDQYGNGMDPPPAVSPAITYPGVNELLNSAPTEHNPIDKEHASEFANGLSPSGFADAFPSPAAGEVGTAESVGDGSVPSFSGYTPPTGGAEAPYRDDVPRSQSDQADSTALQDRINRLLK